MAKFIFHSVLALSMVSAVTNSGLAQEPKAMTSQDVEHLVKELSNWGRWGKDDQLGTLNLITPEKRQEAAKLVKRGVSVSLARNAETTEAADNPKPFGHTMLAFGKGSTGQWAMDNYSVSYHGLAHTHMDSLCHLFHNGKMYNGFSRDEVLESGTKKLGIQNIKGGIFTRGILIDIPRLRGVRFLEPGSAILPSELTAWEERAGIKVRSGRQRRTRRIARFMRAMVKRSRHRDARQRRRSRCHSVWNSRSVTPDSRADSPRDGDPHFRQLRPRRNRPRRCRVRAVGIPAHRVSAGSSRRHGIATESNRDLLRSHVKSARFHAAKLLFTRFRLQM
jgi:hypothetical protein